MKRNVSTLVVVVAALAIAATAPAGCGPATVKTPDGFAQMEYTRQYDWLAVSTDASAVALSVRKNEDPEKGTLDFWTEAARKHMTLSRGYTFKEEGAFSSARGKGRWLLFDKDHKGSGHLYLLGLVVEGDSIFVMEAGGENEVLSAQVPALVKAFGTLD